MSYASRAIAVLAVGLALSGGHPAIAEPAKEVPIFPTWKLLGPEAKRYFVAGYLNGHRDAKVLGEVAVEFLKHNPKKGVDGLQQILNLYRLSNLSASELVPMIEKHLQDPANQSDSLRAAINKLNRTSQ